MQRTNASSTCLRRLTGIETRVCISDANRDCEASSNTPRPQFSRIGLLDVFDAVGDVKCQCLDG